MRNLALPTPAYRNGFAEINIAFALTWCGFYPMLHGLANPEYNSGIILADNFPNFIYLLVFASIFFFYFSYTLNIARKLGLYRRTSYPVNACV